MCANFSLPRPLRSRVRPDVNDRQTSDVQQTDVNKTRLMPLPYEGGGIINALCIRRNSSSIGLGLTW